MAAPEPIAQFTRPMFTFTVYHNRIEIEETGALLLKKKTSILLRNVSGVEMNRVKTQLTVKTNDGKQLKWLLAPRTEELYNAILGAL